MVSIEEIKNVQEEARCLFSHSEIEKSISLLSEKITTDFKNSNPIFICILNGGLPFSASLIAKLSFPLQLDYMHLTRYHGELSGNDIAWIAKPQLELAGRMVVLLDDILDVGLSIQAAKEYCLQQGAKQVSTAVLLKKELKQGVQIESVDYYCLDCPDEYVFGFGMDYKNYCRNFNGIYALKA